MSIEIYYKYSFMWGGAQYLECFNSYNEFVRDFLDSEEYYPEGIDEWHTIIKCIHITFPENESDFQQFLPPLETYFPDSEHISIIYTNDNTQPTLELPKIPTSTVMFKTRGITISNIENILHENLLELDSESDYDYYFECPETESESESESE